VPGFAVLGQQPLIVCADAGTPPCAVICEENEANNCATRPITIALTDLAVTSLQLPAPPVLGGSGQRSYAVTVENLGPGYANTQVTVTIGNPTLTWGSAPLNTGPFGTQTVTASVPTPTVNGLAPSCQSLPVLACVNFTDLTPANNCRSATLSVCLPCWDLRFSIVNEPASAHRGTCITWRVRVENAGNVPSAPNVCFRTGIVLNPGPGIWYNAIGYFDRSAPSIQPGGVWYSNVTFCIPNQPGIILGTQWIKVQTWCDNFSSGNFDQESISILP
jgi:hypothetical protein